MKVLVHVEVTQAWMQQLQSFTLVTILWYLASNKVILIDYFFENSLYFWVFWVYCKKEKGMVWKERKKERKSY